MRKKLSAAVLASQVALLATPALPAHAEQGWKLEQTSDYLGAMTVLASKKAIQVTTQHYDVVFTMTAPTYTVIGWNNKTKTQYTIEYAKWRKRFAAYADAVNTSEKVKAGTEKVGPLTTTRWLLNPMHVKKTTLGPKVAGKTYNTAMYMANDIKLPSEFVLLMVALAHVPTNIPGFPVRIVRYTPLGAVSTMWETTKVTQVQVPDKFQAPKGFRSVDSELALFVGNGPSAATAYAGSPLVNTPKDSDAWDPAADSVAPTASGKKFSKGASREHSGTWAPGLESWRY